jgi:succinate dehydrogenase/fumarate reductase flavoprotein subunit
VRALRRLAEPAHYVFDDVARGRYARLVDQLPSPLITADTLGELAEGIGCDPAALERTVDEWNRRVDHDDLPDEFGRVIGPPGGIGLTKPPFHASQCAIGCAFTVGGARTDAAGRVLSADGTAVIGLYAVGDCAGMVTAASGTGGVHITSALAFGTAAAEALIG